MNFIKRTIAATAFTLCCLGNGVPAQAGETDCWIGKDYKGAQMQRMSCRHTSRINANGHKVQDIYLRGPKGNMGFSLVLWEHPDTKERQLDFILRGETTRVPYWYDDNDDLRWAVHGYEMSLRPVLTDTDSSSSRQSGGRGRVDLDRIMGDDLRRHGSRSEYGL